jgi:hypothetical protein
MRDDKNHFVFSISVFMVLIVATQGRKSICTVRKDKADAVGISSRREELSPSSPIQYRMRSPAATL